MHEVWTIAWSFNIFYSELVQTSWPPVHKTHQNARICPKISLKHQRYHGSSQTIFMSCSFPALLWISNLGTTISNLYQTRGTTSKTRNKVHSKSALPLWHNLHPETYTLDLPPLCYWHEFLDMVTFYKLTHGIMTIDNNLIQSSPNNNRRETIKLGRPIPIICQLQRHNARPLPTKGHFSTEQRDYGTYYQKVWQAITLV
jgi:hypothetical protein